MLRISRSPPTVSRSSNPHLVMVNFSMMDGNCLSMPVSPSTTLEKTIWGMMRMGTRITAM